MLVTRKLQALNNTGNRILVEVSSNGAGVTFKGPDSEFHLIHEQLLVLLLQASNENNAKSQAEKKVENA